LPEQPNAFQLQMNSSACKWSDESQPPKTFQLDVLKKRGTDRGLCSERSCKSGYLPTLNSEKPKLTVLSKVKRWCCPRSEVLLRNFASEKKIVSL
jgi:hypothetical protein